MMSRIVPIAALVLLAGCGGGDDAEQVDANIAATTPAGTASVPSKPSAASVSADESKPPVAFNQCKACHSVKPGEARIGPSLAGVYGAHSGHMAGYNYSAAMKSSGITWDEATLNAFLTKPGDLVPGTKMTFPGYKDDSKRQAVIDYLKTL